MSEPLWKSVLKASEELLQTPTHAEITADFAAAHQDPLQLVTLFAEAGHDQSLLAGAISEVEEITAGRFPAGAREQFLLVTAIAQHAPGVVEMSLDERTTQTLLDAFLTILKPPVHIADRLRMEHPTFSSACQMTIGRRFPVGAYDVDESGIPRSWLPKVPVRDLPRVLWFIARHIRGFSPMLTTHVAVFREPDEHLTEDKARQSHLQIAALMRERPWVRGMLSSSWMRDPAIADVSPHLGALSKPIVENGGIQFTIGPADPHSSGALAKSRSRRRAYEQGAYTPRTGVLVWPRKAMLRWYERETTARGGGEEAQQSR